MKLDLVDRIEIETPCQVSWDSMYGDDRIRHCGRCRKNVYNVASLTRPQALALIASREPVCLRIYRRPDGTVVSADCWARLRAARQRGLWAFVGMLVIVGWAELAAMIVGLAGLGRFVLRPMMGAPPPAPALVAPPPPAAAEVPAGGEDQTIIMGGPRLPPSGDWSLGHQPPAPHKKAKHHPRVEPSGVHWLGRMRPL